MARMSKCKICRTPFVKMSVAHKTCKPECAIELVRQEKEKKAKKDHRAAKVRQRTRREWLDLAQQAFNAYIRARDEYLPCICCGKWPKNVGKYGGDWDAGHYLSRGAFPELRFVEDNCHKQLKECNAGSGKYSAKAKTVSQQYRSNLIKKIGLERVERLEGPHPPAKWSIPELQEIKQTYTDKLKALRRCDK